MNIRRTKKADQTTCFLFLCGRWDLNPHERNAHKILSLARLPVPTLPRNNVIIHRAYAFVNKNFEKINECYFALKTQKRFGKMSQKNDENAFKIVKNIDMMLKKRV